MEEARIKELQCIAQDLRITGLEMVEHAHSGHLGGAFSLSEIMAVLYFEKMNIRPDEPDWEDRDRLVLSKGHATVALYATLASRGFFPEDDLKEFRKIDGYLSGHAEMKRVPGVDMSTGSLGQGLSTALGIAVAARLLGKTFKTYAILGDGEIEEGQIWEACMYAGSKKISNLIIILDSNKVQLDGSVSDILDTGNLVDKFASFGFNVISIDGHNIKEISDSIDKANDRRDKPTLIIANTIKGKGVSFMENDHNWHGKTPGNEEFLMAFEELRETRKRLEV